MSIKITVRVAKGLKNNSSGTQMTWWKTNFNMPVPDLSDDNSNWVRNKGPFIYYGEASSFDFSGFSYGWEAIIGVSLVELTGEPERTLTIKQIWLDSETYFTNQFTYTFPDTTEEGSRHEAFAFSNQGVASWEINNNFNGKKYRLKTEVREDNTLVAEKTTYIGINNVPPDPGQKTPGYIRIDDFNLKYINANGREHTIIGELVNANTSAKPGYIWIDNGEIHWTGDSGYHMKSPVNIKQFASTFSNGPTSEVSGKTPGYIYADNEFGRTHLSIIGEDGYKRLICSGHDPYTDPYD